VSRNGFESEWVGRPRIHFAWGFLGEAAQKSFPRLQICKHSELSQGNAMFLNPIE
jgi:hypothetical protein